MSGAAASGKGAGAGGNGAGPGSGGDYTGYTPELTNSQVIAGTGGVGIDLGVFPPARTVTVGMDLTF